MAARMEEMETAMLDGQAEAGKRQTLKRKAYTSIETTTFLLSVHFDDIKLVRRQESLALKWARIRNKIELEDPTPRVDQDNLGALKEHSQSTKKRSARTPKCFK